MTSPHQQKLRVKGPVVVTANGLADGGVLWWTGSGWSRSLPGAIVVTTEDAARALLVDADADPRAVGAYVAPVIRDDDGTVRPGNLRERIRASGPTTPIPKYAGDRSATAAAGLDPTVGPVS
ncbi:DUF2849 domain-containing protein [Fodinicurvata sp. EGI_FJ10296]|uniref:DUF2849 domain-containing protein n=1 Tax=Fodinicurvata sp. EGI_FJ10296 TaxID=3231908 RepID=UPI00345712D9